MLTAAYFGVPYILHTGDAAAAAEARAVVPAIETATVKWGIARGSASGLDSRQNELFNGAAIHLHPTQARAVIRAAARRAAGTAGGDRSFPSHRPVPSDLHPPADRHRTA